jgi:hypothetical protein
VLVTSLKLEVLAVAQLYRDRGDAENNFDELNLNGAVEKLGQRGRGLAS